MQRQDRRRRVGVWYLVLAALALAHSGCLWIAAGAAAGGAATYVYFKGRVSRAYPASIDDTYAAVNTALGELGLPVLVKDRTAATGSIQSRTADGTDIKIEFETIASRIPAEGSVTRVGVRVGAFGDEAVSERILEQAALHLAPPALVPIPAPGTPPTSVPSPGAKTWAPSGGNPIQPVSATRPAETAPPPLLPKEPVPVKK